MENKNSTTIIILLVFIVGLLLGYMFSGNNMHNGFYSGSMHDEMEDYVGRYDRLYFMEKMIGGELEEESLKNN